MSRIEDHLQMFEAMQQFCSIIGEGWIEPQKETIFFYLLNHPVKKDEKLFVHMKLSGGGFIIYIRAPDEGAIYKSFEEMPLVHAIPDPKRYDRPVFPYAVDIHRKGTTYYYGRKIEGATIILSETVPKKVYYRMRGLFDETNPHPWMERKNPDHKLSTPEPVKK